MACAGLLLVTVLAAVAPSVPNAVRSDTSPAPQTSAQLPRAVLTKPIDLSVARAIHDPAISASGAGLSPRDAGAWQNAGTPPGLSVGPFRTEFGGITGRHMSLATVKLEGVSVFGGSIGGSISSRSARITLSWPTSP